MKKQYGMSCTAEQCHELLAPVLKRVRRVERIAHGLFCGRRAAKPIGEKVRNYPHCEWLYPLGTENAHPSSMVHQGCAL
jgi:hypothetical protein